MAAALLFIAIAYVFNGLFMLIAPQLWYDTIPGVSMLGPYNTHFIRDVGIVYLVCAGGFFWGVKNRNNAVLMFAGVWPALHALYHLQMWAARGFAFDIIALVNFAAIQAPAWVALFAAYRLSTMPVNKGKIR